VRKGGPIRREGKRKRFQAVTEGVYLVLVYSGGGEEKRRGGVDKSKVSRSFWGGGEVFCSL